MDFRVKAAYSIGKAADSVISSREPDFPSLDRKTLWWAAAP
jgi:hypothetical protein